MVGAVTVLINLSGLLDEAKCFEVVRQARWPQGLQCPKCGGGYVIDVPPSARPTCDRDGARLKRASDASYERNARED